MAKEKPLVSASPASKFVPILARKSRVEREEAKKRSILANVSAVKPSANIE